MIARRFVVGCFIACTLMGCGRVAATTEGGPRFELVEASSEEPSGAAWVTGWSALERAALSSLALREGALAGLFEVRVAPRESEAAARPMAGRVDFDGEGLRFSPRFGFAPGVQYAGVVRSFEIAGSAPSTPFEFAFELPRAEHVPSTVVTAVYPSADVLPANVLKFYVHFDAAMRPGEAYERVRLLDEEGLIVEDAFLRLEDELWDPSHTRLSLLLDPGRIKQGLVRHEVLGAPLEARREYRLVIDDGWPDARGTPLAAGFEKGFRTAEHDGASPDTGAWETIAPRAGSREALELRFDEALDRALVLRLASVRAADGQRIEGAIELGAGERSLSFVPDSSWQAAEYSIELAPEVEDLCGNDLRRPFESRPGDAAKASREALAFPFTPAPSVRAR